MSEGCRLTRWREREAIAPETIASLCGIEPRMLNHIEHGGYLDVADEMALKLLFGDRFGRGELLARDVAPDEDQRLDAINLAYQRTLAAWFGK
jgi:transcriptional regulator with XRE-family HTH domain